MKLRLDKLLVERGLAASRERAQALILAGRVLVNEQKIDKCGAPVEESTALRLLGDDLRYVSRGGLKLERAIAYWHIELTGKVCMDVGASTGGFTDCLLQRGAAQVIAIDTGYGQMDATLRTDSRVRLLERTNARYLTREQIWPEGAESQSASLIAMDVSFISATIVLPAVIESVRGENPLQLVVLIKPQFEVGREHVGKGGIVRDEEAQRRAVERVSAEVVRLGGSGIEVIESPILGAAGNREFLLHAWL